MRKGDDVEERKKWKGLNSKEVDGRTRETGGNN